MRAVHFIAVIAPNAAGVETVTPTLSDNPGETTYASDVYPRTVWDMLAWDGRLFIGIGDSAHNVAAPPIWFFDGNSWSDADGVAFDDHAIDLFVITGGKVWIPGHDDDDDTVGNLYTYVSGGTWAVTSPATLNNCAHVYTVYHDGTYLWAGIGVSSGVNAIRRSSDGGATFTGFQLPASGAEPGFTANRVWTIFKVGSTLYASTNAVIFTSIPSGFTTLFPFINVFYWTGAQWDVSAFNFAPNDPLEQEDDGGFTVSGRIVRAVEFAGKTFYFTGRTKTDHDFEPLSFYSITDGGSPVTLTFMGSAKVHDLLVHNNALYALCNELVGDTYTTTVYVTTDGSTWTAALQFVHTDTYTFARSFAFYDEGLYFGYGCYYDTPGDGAGKIVKTSLTTVIILAGGGAAPTAPVNSVAPSISSAAPVIGTPIVGTDGTYTGTAPITIGNYQWQRNTGSWVNIGGATSANYTPVDADFGYTLRRNEDATNAAGTITTSSNATGVTVEAPAQTLGAELVANGNFATWSGDNPSSWSVLGEVGSDPMITESSGKARIYNSATAAQPSMNQTVLTTGAYFELALLVDTVTVGSIRMFDAANAVLGFIATTTGTKRVIGRAAGTTLRIRGEAANSDVIVDDASAKQITPNTQLTAPSANMRVDFFYTLPGTPVQNEQVWLMPRISDFSTGNYWLVLLEYTGTQWNVTMYSVATHTRTQRKQATNIGTTNGLRVNFNGDTLQMFTTANSGSNWTQRDTDLSNSTYNSATGVNVLYSSTVTPGNLVYAPAT